MGERLIFGPEELSSQDPRYHGQVGLQRQWFDVGRHDRKLGDTPARKTILKPFVNRSMQLIQRRSGCWSGRMALQIVQISFSQPPVPTRMLVDDAFNLPLHFP